MIVDHAMLSRCREILKQRDNAFTLTIYACSLH